MYSFKTPFMGYACEWSPFEPNKLAIATAQHFGVVGNGKQHVVQVDTQGIIQQTKIFANIQNNNNNNNNAQQQSIIKPLPYKALAEFNTRDGIYDNAWSELNENHLISACGDGRLRLWDLKSNTNPLRAYIGHNAEVYGVDWNIVSKQHFISASWDQSLKMWDPLRAICLANFNGHRAVVYDAVWCPHNNFMFASCSEDHNLLLWDTRKQASNMNNNLNNQNMNQNPNQNMNQNANVSSNAILAIPAHAHEILSCDFSKYDHNLIATASCDRSIAFWDLRKISKPFTRIDGHRFAVRRIKFSPHHPSIIMSVSYDMTVKLWNYLAIPNPLIADYSNLHSEFVVGCSFNMFLPNVISTVSWDQSCAVIVNNCHEQPQQQQQIHKANAQYTNMQQQQHMQQRAMQSTTTNTNTKKQT